MSGQEKKPITISEKSLAKRVTPNAFRAGKYAPAKIASAVIRLTFGAWGTTRANAAAIITA
jgi:hypothetical protein